MPNIQQKGQKCSQVAGQVSDPTTEPDCVCLPGALLTLDLHTEVAVRVGDLVLAVVPDEARLVGPGRPPGQAAQEAQEDSLEFVAENAVNDEVDGAVDGDEEVISLCQRMILMTKMLKK